MKKIIAYIMGVFVLMCYTLAHSASTTNGDAVSQAYAVSNSLKIQENVPGISLIGGQITHSQNLISGKLPYSISYVGSVRNSLSASNDYFDQFLTTGGWTDNYQNSVRFFSMNDAAHPTYGYYAIRLPGSRQDIWLHNTNRSFCSGGVMRAYSSDVLGVLAYQNGANLVWSCETHGYQFTENANGSITINYRGTTFTTTTNKVTQSGTTYFRIASVQQPQGDKLTFGYDSYLNMVSVADGRNNQLTFTRTYQAGTTQTVAEKRLITKVELTSGIGTKQNATFTYGSYNSQDANGNTGSIYYPVTATSTISAKTTFGYTPIKQWAIDGYLNFIGKTISNTNAATLTSLKDSNNVLRREWLVTQNYATYNSNTKTYATAKVTLQVRTPIGSSSADDYTVNYDDNARTAVLTTKPDGITNSTVTYTIVPKPKLKVSESGQQYNDDGELEITVSGTLPALTIDNQVPKTITMHSWYDLIPQIVMQNGLVITQDIDVSARPISTSYAYTGLPTKTTTYSYGTLTNGAANPYLVPTIVKTPLLTITNQVNANGQIIKQTQTSSQTGSTSKVTDYTYYTDITKPDYGLISSVDGPRTGTLDKITYVYDTFGNLASQSQIVNAVARITQYMTYNNFAQPERTVYPTGLVEQYVYNADGTLKSQTIGVGGTTGTITGQTTSYTYNTLKQKISETNPDAEVTQFAYDTIGRLVQTTLPNGNRIQKAYFPNGVVSSEKSLSSSGVVTAQNYQYLDANGRVSKTQQGSDSTRRTSTILYDVNGNVGQTTSAEGITERWTYDAFNRLVSHMDGILNIDNKKAYDLQDNVILSKDALNAGSDPFSYRNGNVLTQEVNTDYGTKTYTYNEADQLTQRLHGPRKCNYNTLDELGRYKAFVCAANSGTTASEYQVNDNYSYDQSRYGRLDKVTTGVTGYDVDTLYTYDAYDRVIQKGTTNQLFNRYAGTTGKTLNVNYGYSTGGKLTSMTLPSGRSVTYSYSTTGMLTGINLNGSALVRSLSYDGANRVTGWQWGASGNAGYTQSYNNDGSIASLTNKDNASAVNYSLTFGYDKDGRINLITRNNGTADQYMYDAADRLTYENRKTGATAIYTIGYTYDKNGNRIRLLASGQHMQPAAGAEYTYTANTNKLATFTKNGIAQTFSYTANSELSYGTYLPTYDYSGRRKVDRASTDYYFMNYNHKNERSFRDKVVNGAVATMTQYIYDEQSHLIGEYDKTGALVEYVWMGDKPVAAIYGSGATTKIYYIVTDHLNTPRRLVDGVTHAVVWSWDSTAFGVGNPTGSITFNLRFPGQYYDVGTNQFYNHNRFYNPELGRYMEPDPIGLEGGLNPYAYAGSNPVMNIDPSGLSLTQMDDFGLSMTRGSDYSLDNMILNQQINQFNNLQTLNIGYGPNYTSVSYDNSYENMWALGYGGSYKAGGWTPEIVVDRKYISNSLQTFGTGADVAAVGCLFSVVCAPVAPTIKGIGYTAGTAGILLDPDTSGVQKGLSAVVPAVVGGWGKNAVVGKTVSDKAGEVYGTVVDKLAGKTIDASFECRQKKTC
ncbi:RHS repeat-associated core domain-containing protein [Acinetobacter lactucae]|uniref:RHS repeat-associated core domain-containing protein n=1 Tax=Acinetobacter lactucae TaxID=1785128 RepID=UPI0003DFA773|nr:RHS repeat-associated core domain-containing protein [Acinetobacter lactucae]ETR93732.1 RHS repeat-associated core domain protein [Acinetobacter lactucae]